MKHVLLASLLLVSLALVFCKGTPKIVTSADSTSLTDPPNVAKRNEDSAVTAGPKCLVKAYPDFLKADDNNAVLWKDGAKMVFDDGTAKSDFETMLDHASLKDQMSICYTKGDRYPLPPPINDDPGRIRFEPFFLKMYGNTPEEVRNKLVPIIWLPKHIHKQLMVTTVNGIDQKLKAISDELDALPQEYVQYLENPGGTFNWRPIAGTNRLSTHSFGMTIDINVKSSDYWRDNKPDGHGLYPYKNRIPMKIVEIFERHGFIWGGKWYHYDTMHFEYRPELLADDCICK